MMNATTRFPRFVLLAATLLLSALSCFAMPPKKDRQFYEMRVYRFKNETQKALTEDYLRSAALPALNRAGIAPVGVFGEADQKDGLKLYVLIPYRSLEQMDALTDKLAADATYQQAAAPYLNAPSNEPAYDRIESSLLHAFPHWPTLKAPTTSAPKSARVYEYRIYLSATEKTGLKKIEMFDTGGEIGIFERLGFNPMFFSQVIVGGKLPCLAYMTTFDNRESRDAHWKAFGSDPEWKRISGLPEYQNVMTTAETHFLTPTEYSQL
jgi:hypothetical protein